MVSTFLIYLSFLVIKNVSADAQLVELSVWVAQFTQTQIYTSRMKTGHNPLPRFVGKEYYRIENALCDGNKDLKFMIGGKNYKCPINDDHKDQKFNDTHIFGCPTFCQVCKEDLKCLRTSYSDIFFTPDGRSIDNITFHYGILDKVEEREINYFIFWAYLFIFCVSTGAVVYAFTE